MMEEFVDLLLSVTEAMLGAIALLQEGYNPKEDRVEYRISQGDLACLFYSVWPYVAGRTNYPIITNPEQLFLSGLTDIKNDAYSCPKWSAFVKNIKTSEDPFKALEDQFKVCSSQTFFDVDSNELYSGEAFAAEVLREKKDVRENKDPLGQINARLNVFIQTLLVMNIQGFDIQRRIKSYICLFLIFSDGNLFNALEDLDKHFDFVTKELDDEVKKIVKDKSGNDRARSVKNFIWENSQSLDETINSIAGNCYKKGKVYVDKVHERQNTGSHLYGFSKIFHWLNCVEEKSRGSSLPGNKYENFYYWLQNAMYYYERI